MKWIIQQDILLVKNDMILSETIAITINIIYKQ